VKISRDSIELSIEVSRYSAQDNKLVPTYEKPLFLVGTKVEKGGDHNYQNFECLKVI
jgi:hypothetical protein